LAVSEISAYADLGERGHAPKDDRSRSLPC